jgi:uncharacterized membrane protein
MMSEPQYDLLLAVFEDESAASESFKTLHEEEKKKLLDLENVVLIRKGVDDKIHVKESAEKISKEAGLGALVGGALGILAGPVGLVSFGAAGAFIGALSAKLDDVGFSDDRLERLGEALQPGNSAILAVLDEKYTDQLVEELSNQGAKVVKEDLPKDFGELLGEGGGWAYRIAAGEADEAAYDLGLVEPEVKDFVSDVDEHLYSEPEEPDPNSAFPKF